jgi:hypothetical protein
MTHNPILRELYDIRAKILAEHGGDLGAYIRGANERAAKSGHPIAQVEQRTIRRTETAKSSGDR